MINSIKFNSSIQNIRNISFKSNPVFENQADVFVKSNEAKLEQEKAKLRKIIIEKMQHSDKEYAFILSKDGKVLDEFEGTEKTCSFDKTKLQDGCIALHGHPVKSPLSPQDIAALLVNNIDSIEAVSPDGKISRMTKTDETPSVNVENIRDKLSEKICLKFLDAFGVDYTETEEELVGLFKDYLSNIGIDVKNKDYNYFLSQMKSFGFYDGKSLSKGYKNVYNALYATTYDREFLFDKKTNAIESNRQRIKDETYTPLGIKICNEFLNEIAEEYHLQYETDIE